jgi:hypothetical protein
VRCPKPGLFVANTTSLLLHCLPAKVGPSRLCCRRWRPACR